ncbi:MAG TPA: flagellar basal body rod C-terminal domain-containing protein, partial [Acidothermaceae bacterium]|nr:flagellar basal body rod C-terminal domain-containing protein [Acidothermaceae bacterium]
ATSLFNIDPSKSSVGQLTLTSTSGNTIDLVQQKALQSGTLAALVNLRDTTLVQAQGELDSIAAGVSKAFSTTQTSGTAASAGGKSGYSLDLGTIRDGDDFTLDYSQGGTDKSLRVINSTTPTDYVDANGMRVVSVDMSGDASAVVSKLSAILGPSFTVNGSGSGPSAAITVLDDGAAGTTDVGSLTANATVTGLQTGAAAFSLFTDNNNSDFTGSLSGQGQQTGFAARIQVNSAVQSDNRLLVQYQSGTSLGDPTRANQALNQLQGLIFASPQSVTTDPAATRLGGTISGMISQTMDDVGNMAATASTNNDTQSMTMDSINQRLGTAYGVNVDDEMARLIQLQNAYSANARVISTVQDLMNQLMQI